MVGAVRQFFAVAVALGAADARFSPGFSDFTAAEDLLHTDRIDLTQIEYRFSLDAR